MRHRLRTALPTAACSAALAAGLVACGDDDETTIGNPPGPTVEDTVGADGPTVDTGVEVGENVSRAPDGERERAMERAVREAGGGRVVAIDFDMDDDGTTDEDGDGLTNDRWSVVVEEDGDRTLVVLDRDLKVVTLEAL